VYYSVYQHCTHLTEPLFLLCLW